MQKSLHLGWNALDVWSLTSTLSPTLVFLGPLCFSPSFHLWLFLLHLGYVLLLSTVLTLVPH